MSKAETINIWCDGSYRQATQIAGAGWLVRYPGGREESKALTLPPLKNSFNYGSDIAELRAAAEAMKTLPEGSNAVVHMDCLSAMTAIEKGILQMKGREHATDLEKAFASAVVARNRLGNVRFELTSDRNLNMSMAHRLSREASSARHIKTMVSR